MLSSAVSYAVGIFCLTSIGLVKGQVRYPCENYAPNDVALLNHATSCSKYVICLNGHATIMNCAPDLRFDVEEGQCQVDANCIVEDLPCPLYDDPNDLVFHYHPDFCNRFALCASGELRNRTCARGLHWDPVNKWCNFPEIVNCPVSVDCPAEGIYYLPHPHICNKFFVCINGEKDVAECADNLIFDVNRETCFFKDQSTCILDVEQEKEPDTNTEIDPETIP